MRKRLVPWNTIFRIPVTDYLADASNGMNLWCLTTPSNFSWCQHEHYPLNNMMPSLAILKQMVHCRFYLTQMMKPLYDEICIDSNKLLWKEGPDFDVYGAQQVSGCHCISLAMWCDCFSISKPRFYLSLFPFKYAFFYVNLLIIFLWSLLFDKNDKCWANDYSCHIFPSYLRDHTLLSLTEMHSIFFKWCFYA